MDAAISVDIDDYKCTDYGVLLHLAYTPGKQDMEVSLLIPQNPAFPPKADAATQTRIHTQYLVLNPSANGSTFSLSTLRACLGGNDGRQVHRLMIPTHTDNELLSTYKFHHREPKAMQMLCQKLKINHNELGTYDPFNL
jgi:hypothetical protein